MISVKQRVQNFNTKYEIGFTEDEKEKLIDSFPSITMERFNKQLGINTGLIIDNDYLTFNTDIIFALTCIIENREPRAGEWD
jgi:hypothetical protein